MKRYLIDTFSFNGEWIVKLRLQYLDPIVDEFVIVEAWQTHSGNKKVALFADLYKDWFVPYIHKIKWVIIKEFPPIPKEWREAHDHHGWMLDNHEHWFRETYQRDSSSSYIYNKYSLDSEYMVLVSDVDEIPSIECLKRLSVVDDIIHEPIFLEMQFYYYNFHWKKQYMWYKAFVILDDKGETPFSTWRVNYTPKYLMKEAGWHLSYFMSPSDLTLKLSSFAHRECDKNEYHAVEHIKKCFKEGKDIFMRGESEDLCPIDNSDILTIPNIKSFMDDLNIIQS